MSLSYRTRRRLRRLWAVLLVLALLAVAALLLWLHFVDAGPFVTGAGGLVIGVGIYFAVCALLKVEELGMLKGLIRKR